MKVAWVRRSGLAFLAVLACLSASCGGDDAPSAAETADAGAPDAFVNERDSGLDAGPIDVSSDTEGAPDASEDVLPNVPEAAPDVVVDASVEDAPADALAEAPPGVDGGHADAKPDVVANCGRIKCDCTFNGKKLWGRVALVDAFPDVKVRVVDAFEDLRVQNVDAFADGCGKWVQDDAFPDLKVQIVDFFEDFSVRYVDFDPGLPP
jgi:hypothetical protein